MSTAIFQFASGSIHFATSLEILRNISSQNDTMFYYLWGARTKYPGRMSVGFESFSGNPPKLIKELVQHAHINVNLTSQLNFDHNWVLAVTDELSNAISQSSDISMLKDIDVRGIKPGAALAN